MLLFFSIAFVSVRFTPPRKLNQLTIGSIGEAKILNPILSTTTADSEILGKITSGLVRYDEDINIVPDLAERWTIMQTSTLFFESADAAAAAVRQLESDRGEWKGQNLTSARQDGSRVLLGFDQAGTAFQDWLLALLANSKPMPVAFLRVSLDDKAKWENQAVTSDVMLPVLLKELGGRVLDTFRNTSTEFDLVVAGDTDPVRTVVNRLLKSDLKEGALGQCEVAETFPVLNEPQIVFQIRKGVRWHDGKPFTARDVEFTYRMLVDEKVASPRRPDFELVKRVEMADDWTVRIVYRKPYAPCLISWSMGMLPQHILDGKDTAWWAQNFNRNPIGTGPYKFDAWKTSEYVRMRRNEDYWEGKPHIEWVTIRVIPDMVALRLLFETGEIDYWGVEPHANKKFREDPRYDVFRRQAAAFSYVGWNLRRPMFQDLRVRRALAHAVNVQQIIDFVYYGQGVRCTGPFPPQMWFANPNVQPLPYDPEKAKALLAEAGWKPGADGYLEKNGEKFEFTLTTNQGNEIRKDIATLVQSDLKKLGIKVEVQLFEWAVFIAQYINKQDFDAMVLGWSLGYDYDQYQLWHSSQTKPGMLNHCSYVNKDVDKWLEEARSEFDTSKARESLWKIHQQIYDDQPYLFLEVPMSTGALRKGEFRVKRPDGKGGWIDEDIRSTAIGFGIYMDWWYRTEARP